MRLAVYGAASTAVAVGVVLSAFNQRANFYSASVYLAQSNACLMVLTNLLILMAIIFGHGLQRLFYGPLRTMEVEQIYEKAWYAVTETCLAMTIFRDEFDVRFIIMFGVLLFVKCFSWIGGGRVEFMEQQPPERPVLFHIRLASSLVLLCAACGGMVWHAVTAVLERGKPNMMVMFAFEFAILLITSAGILARYVLSLVEKYILRREAQKRKEARAIERVARSARIEQQRAENTRRRAAGEEEQDVEEEADDADDEDDDELDVGGWEDKGTWVFYTELCTDFLKLITYLSFFSIVLTWYGLPLHIIRDVYLTLRSFITRIRDFVRYRRATAHMNSRYPDASAEEVEREGVCIICREEMRPWTGEGNEGDGARTPGAQDQRHRAKKLPCGHVLHFSCLRSWLERQQRCPTCRRPVLDENAAATNANANANGNPQNGAPAAPAARPGFQAQFGIGPLGFDIGIGGPAMVENFLERMNQQNQQAQQGQAQQGQQGQQGQNIPLQPGAQAPQQNPPFPGMAQPQQPAMGAQGGVQPNTTAGIEIEQHILRTRQLIEREHLMIQMSYQQLQQLQHLQRVQLQQDTANGTTGTTPVPPPTTAQVPPVNPPAPGAALPTPNIPGFQPVFNNQAGTPAGIQPPLPYMLPPQTPLGVPQGMVLPPGWSLIPLTVVGGTALGTQRTAGNNVLASRRGHRTYQENMRTYHQLRTPTERSREEAELGSNLNRPGLGRTASAPVGRLPTPTRASTNPDTTRYTASVLLEALQLLWNSGKTDETIIALNGIPPSLRTTILSDWPDRDQAHEIETTAIMITPHIQSQAVSTIASVGATLSRSNHLRFLLGLPAPFRNRVLTASTSPDAASLRADLEPTSTIPTIPELPDLAPLAPTTDLAREDQETHTTATQRIEALNSASRAMHEAADSLERSVAAAASGSSVPTPSSFASDVDAGRLALFGEQSMFSLPAQVNALRNLERDLVEREPDARVQNILQEMLGSSRQAAEVEGTEGEEEIKKEEAETGPSAEEKGKGVDRSATATADKE